MRETLAGLVAARDAARFVGRVVELIRLEGMLTHDPPVNVVLLHGPGGVGKSALLRELARRAAARGATIVDVEARGLAPLAEELDRALAPAMTAPRPLVLLDSWERVAALDGHLRRHILPRLPADALVVIASRHAPGRSWFSAGWDHVVLDLPLSPLGADDADALLAVRGVEDAGRRAAAVAWAGGSPLALVLVANPSVAIPAGPDDDAPPEVIDALLRRLLDSQPEGEGRAVLAVAALARVTTPALLAAVLPDVDAPRCFAWLCEHPSAEPLGDGVTLHDLVGRTLRADLRGREPELERDLRRRLVDALYARGAGDGLLRLTLDLQHLVQDPAIRWGFAWDPSGKLRIDGPRLGDADAIAARSGRAARVWLADARRWFDEAPERVTVIRDEDDSSPATGSPPPLRTLPRSPPRTPSSARACATPRARCPVAPPSSSARPSTSRTARARASRRCWGSPGSSARASPTRPRPTYPSCAATPPRRPSAPRAARARSTSSWSSGPACAWSATTSTTGQAGCSPSSTPRSTASSGCHRPPRCRPSKRSARRCASSTRQSCWGAGPWHRPRGRSRSAPRRCGPASSRRSKRRSASRGEDRELREALVRAYLDPAASPEQAAADLNLSRAAYLRRLRAAVARVAAHIATERRVKGD